MTQRDGFEEKARDALRDQAERVPPEVATRLAAARRAAMDQYRQPRAGWGFGMGLSAAGAAAAVALAVGLLLVGEEEIPALPPGLVMADEAEISAAQEAELLSELEFLAWLEANDVDAG